MSLKKEHPLNIDPETKKTTGIGDDCAKTQDEKAKVKKTVDTQLNMPFKNDGFVKTEYKKAEAKSDDGYSKTQDKKAEVKSDDGCAETHKKKDKVKSNDGCVITQDKKTEVKNIVDSELNTPVTKEHPLNIDSEIKNTPGIRDDCCAETQDKKPKVLDTDDTEPERVEADRPIFKCQSCNMTERYDYLSDHTPFNRSVRTKIDYYLTKDPFSPRTKRQVLILGSICSKCNKNFCIKPECSIFYSHFYCITCARQNIKSFPRNIQNKIKAVNRI